MTDDRYSADILGGSSHWSSSRLPVVTAVVGEVIEDVETRFCGAITKWEHRNSTTLVFLEDRLGTVRSFAYYPASFSQDGRVIALEFPRVVHPTNPVTLRNAAGSRQAPTSRATVAKQSRIWVEGIHDAELVEKIWGDDLRAEGIVVEPLHGLDDVAQRVAEFDPSEHTKLGILVDHLVAGSKESRLVSQLGPHVLVTGHEYIDIWQAVKPQCVGITQWPVIPRGEDWKTGMCHRLGWPEPGHAWKDILSKVTSFRDIEPQLFGAVERLVDFVCD